MRSEEKLPCAQHCLGTPGLIVVKNRRETLKGAAQLGKRSIFGTALYQYHYIVREANVLIVKPARLYFARATRALTGRYMCERGVLSEYPAARSMLTHFRRNSRRGPNGSFNFKENFDFKNYIRKKNGPKGPISWPKWLVFMEQKHACH